MRNFKIGQKITLLDGQEYIVSYMTTICANGLRRFDLNVVDCLGGVYCIPERLVAPQTENEKFLEFKEMVQNAKNWEELQEVTYRSMGNPKFAERLQKACVDTIDKAKKDGVI